MGQIEVGENWNWFCPHIIGGIPTGFLGVARSVYEMKLDVESRFLFIYGITDDKI